MPIVRAPCTICNAIAVVASLSVLTELNKKAWADTEKREAMESTIPTGRVAVPEEVTGAIEYLVSDAASMSDETDLRIDGGFTIH